LRLVKHRGVGPVISALEWATDLLFRRADSEHRTADGSTRFRSSSGRQAPIRNCIPARNPMHQTFGTARPSSVFRSHALLIPQAVKSWLCPRLPRDSKAGRLATRRLAGLVGRRAGVAQLWGD
jgi:hypothetical protein